MPPSTTTISAYDALIALIWAATSISNEKKEEYVKTLEQADPNVPLPAELRTALRDLCKEESGTLSAEIEQKEKLVAHLKDIATEEEKQNAGEEQAIIREATKEMDQVVQEYEQECQKAEQGVDRFIEEELQQLEKDEAQDIKTKLGLPPSQGDQKKDA